MKNEDVIKIVQDYFPDFEIPNGAIVINWGWDKGNGAINYSAELLLKMEGTRVNLTRVVPVPYYKICSDKNETVD